MTEPDVVVVGAGPGGLAAASAAAEAGARVLVVDESPILGGQYLRPRHPRPVTHPVVERFRASGAEAALGESVWFVDAADRRLRTSTLDVRYRGLVVATGAYDRPVAVAGADLPGVVAAGGAQALAKDGVRLGAAVLVVGSGPFALPVSAEVSCTGADVVEIALSRLPWMGTGPLHAPGTVREAGHYGRLLARHRVPVRSGWVLDQVLGSDRVEGAVLTDGSRRREVGCDAVAVGYGFLPQLAVADLAGCRLRFDDVQRTWFVDVDAADLATSVPGVYAAGEITGIGGHRKAMAEGVVAGHAAARHAGCSVPVDARAARGLRRAARFARAARRALAPPSLASSVPDAAVVCRCEEVPAAAIRAAARDGAVTVSGARMRTRCGMGPCQGRMCVQLCGELIDAELGRAPGSAGRLASRVPLRPMTMRELVS